MPHYVANNVSSNVIQFPTFGQAITLDDQGVYYAQNAVGDIVGVFQLAYQDDWVLYQLDHAQGDDMADWKPLMGDSDYTLNSLSTEQIRGYFLKPEYAEPRGAWQVIKNSKFGIGKFTPMQAGEPICYAMLVFVGQNMLRPIRIHKYANSELTLPQTFAGLAVGQLSN